jgi:hypothetical protein
MYLTQKKVLKVRKFLFDPEAYGPYRLKDNAVNKGNEDNNISCDRIPH